MSDAQTTLAEFDSADIGTADHDATDAADDLLAEVEENRENINKLAAVIEQVSENVSVVEEVATLALGGGETTDSADADPDTEPDDARMFQ